jgi:hypothetical protein
MAVLAGLGGQKDSGGFYTEQQAQAKANLLGFGGGPS